MRGPQQFGPRMTWHQQQLFYRYDAADLPDREYDRLYRNLGFSDDRIVAICYTISKWVIACLGPVFWICLVYLLLVAEFAR